MTLRKLRHDELLEASDVLLVADSSIIQAVASEWFRHTVKELVESLNVEAYCFRHTLDTKHHCPLCTNTQDEPFPKGACDDHSQLERVTAGLELDPYGEKGRNG